MPVDKLKEPVQIASKKLIKKAFDIAYYYLLFDNLIKIKIASDYNHKNVSFLDSYFFKNLK